MPAARYDKAQPGGVSRALSRLGNFLINLHIESSLPSSPMDISFAGSLKGIVSRCVEEIPPVRLEIRP